MRIEEQVHFSPITAMVPHLIQPSLQGLYTDPDPQPKSGVAKNIDPSAYSGPSSPDSSQSRKASTREASSALESYSRDRLCRLNLEQRSSSPALLEPSLLVSSSLS